jgi:hypothetical protein
MSGDSGACRTKAQQMRVTTIAALLCGFVIAGCAGLKSVPPDTQSQRPAPLAATDAAEPASPPAAPSTTARQSATKAEVPAAKAPAKAPVTKAPAAQPPQKQPAAPTVTAKAPTLDLKSLEQRLKETDAIGVLTKIALKNQVDDLLDQFRAYYQGKVKTTLAELRRPYDLLVLKVLSLLQDSDPALASAIAASREAIWGILADRDKFATVA